MQFFVTQPVEAVEKSTPIASRIASRKRRRGAEAMPNHDRHGHRIKKSAGLCYARAMAETALDLALDEGDEEAVKAEQEELLYIDEELAKATPIRTRSAPYGTALKNSLAVNGADLHYEAEVASIAVMDGDKLLMGKRRDSGRWTLPGGHLEPGEDPHEGALRELAEETGIEVPQLNYLGSQGVVTELGKSVLVHSYHLTCAHDATVRQDPDQEVSRWRWIDCRHGLPAHIASNLHAKRNVTLMFLDIYRSFGAGLYVTDLVKARSHKYLRKYKGRNGEWVYIYHEGQAPGRAITPEAHQHIRELAELGHEPSKQLVDSTEEHNEEKLKHLRELADLGHEPAHEHLKTLGIDRHAERKEEKKHAKKKAKEAAAQEAERQILGDNELNKPLQGEDLNELTKHVTETVKREVFDHLASHTSTPIGRALQQSGLTVHDIVGDAARERTITGHVNALHEGLKKLDNALSGATSGRSEIVAAGGYGNYAFNKVMEKLVSAGYLPEAANSHKRTAANQGGVHVLPHDDLRAASHGMTEQRHTERRDASARAEREARQAQERREREQAERQRAEQERAAREAAENAATERELGGSLAMHMGSLMSNGRLDATKTRELHRSLKAIFGGEGLKKEHWPYDFSAHGLKTKITRLSASGANIHMEMQIYDAQGNPMMEGWTRTWSKDSDGRPVIDNNFMAVDPKARSNVQVGNLINQGQRDLMRSQPRGGRVKVHANCDVGGYNWCNQGFSWNNASDASHRRQNFKRFLQEHGINLTDEDLSHFKEPVHFAAFDDGRVHVTQISSLRRSRGGSLPLSKKQKESGSLSGVEGKHPLTADEIRTGKTQRMALHLGKKFMLGDDWYGTWDSARETDAAKFADAYYQLRDRAGKHLAPQYKNVVSETKAGRRGAGRVEEAPAPAVPRSSFGSTPAPAEEQSEHTSRYVRYWHRDTSRNIVLSPRRMSTIGSWTRDQISHFARTAPLAPNARRRLQELARSRPS